MKDSTCMTRCVYNNTSETEDIPESCDSLIEEEATILPPVTRPYRLKRKPILSTVSGKLKDKTKQKLTKQRKTTTIKEKDKKILCHSPKPVHYKQLANLSQHYIKKGDQFFPLYPEITTASHNLQFNLTEHPVHIAHALLELSLERQDIIDHYFDIAEKMLFSSPPGKGSFDEWIYMWMTQGHHPQYTDRYTPEQRLNRLNKYTNRANKKRQLFFEAMKRYKDEFQPDILSCSLFESITSNEQQSASYLHDSVVSSSIQTRPFAELHEHHGVFGTFINKTHQISTASSLVDPNNIIQSTDSLNDLRHPDISDSVWLDKWVKDQTELLPNNISTQPFIGINQIQFLQSKVIRLSSILDWSPREIALFEIALCQYGPDFSRISSIIGTKSYKQSYSFYAEVFKQTHRYQSFKEFKKLANWYAQTC